MSDHSLDHTLEFLLAFDGRIHHLEKGYWIKFAIKRVASSKSRAHGLSYSFTLHAPNGTRLVGFDNAHSVLAPGGPFKSRSRAADHWHRAEGDTGRPYAYKDAETLLTDFFNEVERELRERGVGMAVISVDATRSSK